ncbi:hypothetical protein Tco_0041121 [Tanacetum coccineum]
MYTYLKNMEGWKPKDLKNKPFANIQELFDKAKKRVNTFVDYRTELVEGSLKKADAEIAQESSSKRAGDKLEQESIKKQKVDKDKETAELKRLMQVIPDEEEVAIDVIPLATKPPTIVDWKIHKEGKNNYYQIIRADGSSKMYRVFSLMLKSFGREDLEDLYNLVKAKYGSTRPVEDLDLILYGDLKTMFDPHGRIVGIKRLLDDLRVTAAKLVLLEKIEENILITTDEKIKTARRFSTIKERIKTAQKKDKDCLKIKITYVINEFVNKPVVENCKAMSSQEEPKAVRKNDDAPIIEEWVSDSEEENVFQTKTEKKTVKPSIAKIEFVKPKQQKNTTRKTVKQVKKHRQNTHNPRGN